MKCRLLLLVSVMALRTSVSFASKAHELILQGKAALVLNNTRLYQDSSYLRPSDLNLRENDLVELIQSTTNEFPDNAQNQQFKWYLVKTLQGQTGWLFGDEVATYNAIKEVDTKLRPFIHQKKKLCAGFENSLIWFASLEGKDIKKGKRFFNPLYKEYYAIATNEMGQSLALNYANISESGTTKIDQAWIADVTKDGFAEIILVKSMELGSEQSPTINIEIYSIQAGDFHKIWEENLQTATLDSNPPRKYVMLQQHTIRVSYMEWVPSSQYNWLESKALPVETSGSCLYYSTYSLQWDRQKKRYEQLYPLTQTAPKATILQNGKLYAQPSLDAAVTYAARSGESCSVRCSYLTRPGSHMDWFLVHTTTGITGYLPKADLRFEAAQVRDYFSQEQGDSQQSEKVVLVE